MATELYSEKFTVKVNEEEGEGGAKFREVILKGTKTSVPVVFRNVTGTKDLKDSESVELIIRTIPKKQPAKKTAAKKTAVKAAPVKEVNDSKAKDSQERSSEADG